MTGNISPLINQHKVYFKNYEAFFNFRNVYYRILNSKHLEIQMWPIVKLCNRTFSTLFYIIIESQKLEASIWNFVVPLALFHLAWSIRDTYQSIVWGHTFSFGGLSPRIWHSCWYFHIAWIDAFIQNLGLSPRIWHWCCYFHTCKLVEIFGKKN